LDDAGLASGSAPERVTARANYRWRLLRQSRSATPGKLPDVAEIEYPRIALQDEVVALRAPRQSDVPAVTAACQDPLIARFTLVPSPYSEDDAREWLLSAERDRREGSGLHFAATAPGTGELRGAVGISEINWRHRVGQVGYWVAPEARGRGVATRSLRLLARWALSDLGLARVEVRVDVENEVSQSVAEAAGFVREGVLRSRAESKGRRWDEVMFSLLPADLDRAAN
jgi:RimJ/RimL family protein N-acetyltransferase